MKQIQKLVKIDLFVKEYIQFDYLEYEKVCDEFTRFYRENH